MTTPTRKPTKRVRRVKAWLVWDGDACDVWRERSGLPMIWSTTKGLGEDVPQLRHVPCTITYTEPPSTATKRGRK